MTPSEVEKNQPLAAVALEPNSDHAVAPSPPPRAAGPQRLHPSSLLFEFLSGIRQQLIPALIAVFTATQWGKFGLFLAAIFFVITMAFAAFRYLTVRYQVRGNDLIIDEGLIFRRHRTIPIHRIQNIDLLQTILHRLFRVAEVRIETASGTGVEAKLRVLSLAKVETLRARIFAKMGEPGLPLSTNPTAEATPERHLSDEALEPTERLLIIPTGLLIKAGLLSNRGMVIVAVAVGASFQFLPWGQDWWDYPRRLLRFIPWQQLESKWLLATMGIILLLIFLRLFSVVWYLLRFHGFSLERRGEEFRIQCGLFSRMSATVPRQRIQLISIHRTLLGKLVGIASIRVETAGGKGTDSENDTASISRRWFIPVLRESDVPRLMCEIRPGIQWNEVQLPWMAPSPRAAVRMRRVAIVIGLAITGLALWYLAWWGLAAGAGICVAAWCYAGKKAATMRYARGEFGIAFRSGLITKKCSITFLERVQTVWLDNSPFDRRWRMATLCIDTAGAGPAEHKIHVPLLDANFARQELQAIARQASLRRAELR